ncbi:hypothetical protein ACK8HX_06435 [Oryzobacter sp. R7]|uniref:hypothetical protein n=1 Tax=Oryzobacter faecalis TaxID=3388656 RepID=UPI00398CA816
MDTTRATHTTVLRATTVTVGMHRREVRDRGSSPPLLLTGPRLTAAWVLSLVVLGLMVVASALGLFVDALYPEQTWAVAALRGNDLVTLVVAAPTLALALGASWRAATAASVTVWVGMLFYGVYNFAYYAFGARFSDVFLLHVAAFSASAAGLVLLGTSIDAPAVARRLASGVRARVVAVFSVLVGLALVAAWGGLSVRFAVTGDLPPEDVMPPEAVHLVYALDLGVLAPAFLTAGVLLWRRIPWGAVLTAAVTASGAAYLAVLWAVGGFQADAGIDGRTWWSPVAIGSALACLAAAVVMLVPPSAADDRDG